MKNIIRIKIFLFSLVLISMLCSTLPSFADVPPPPLSYIEAYINKKGFIVIPSPKQSKAYSPRYFNEFGDSELQPIQVGNYWGYSDKNGKIIIKPQFDKVQNFSEGLAAVYKNKKWGYINEKGAWAIQPKFPSAMCYGYREDGSYAKMFYKCNSSSQFHGGLAPVSYEEEIKVRYGEGLAATYLEPVFSKGKEDIKGEVKGYIKNGKFYVEGTANTAYTENAASYKYGYIRVTYKNCFIDKTGKIVIKGDFEEPQPFSEGLAVARGKYGQYGYIDKTGKFAIKPQFDHANSFSDGIAYVTIPAYRIIFPFSAVLLVLIIIASISIKKSNRKEIDDKSEHN